MDDVHCQGDGAMTSEDVSKMIVEIVTDKPRTVEGPEAEGMYTTLEQEIADIQAQGLDVDVTAEIPDFD